MELMHRLADEIRAVFEDRGYKVGKATGLDPAFRRSRRSQSTLSRDLVLDAIEEATQRLGIGFKSVGGGGFDIAYIVDGVDRRFRVRKAEVDPDSGEYDIICKSDNIMVIEDAEPDSMFPTERWVLSYTVDSHGMVVDIFAARVLGTTENSVPRLRLGPITPLGEVLTIPPTPGTYVPADEDDLGDFDDDQQDEGGESDLG
jgi:hypothetical protein